MMQKIQEILQGRFADSSCKSIGHETNITDLPGLLKMAKVHGVNWLVCDELQKNRALADSASLVKSSREASIAALRNCADLVKIAEISRQHSIPVVFFKGAALAAGIHGNVAARRYCDIDLLVPSYEQAERLKRVLMAKGYRDTEELADCHTELKRQHHIEFQLVSPAGIGLDIHWRLFHEYYLQIPGNEKKIASQSFVLVCGHRIPTLSPEDHLLVLCAHHTTHCWNELRLVCDVAGLVKAFPEIDYHKLFVAARRIGAARMLALGLQLAKLMFLLTLPEAAELELRRDRLSRMLAIILCRRLATGSSLASKSDSLLIEIAARDSWRERLLFVWRAMISPSDNDFRFVYLQPPWLWLYYLARPLRQIVSVLRN
ncbi:MAG: nucleotidyltransferase family protein [Candidatus Riflebacteria bacterium]|nr:nucleotidyltransferase family protein [Candidatus Riflebacteria bacterium]